MNNPQDAHQEEGPDSEILKLSNGGGAKIEKNNVDIPEEPFPTSPPHVITNSVAVTENPILSTTAILSEEVLPAVKVSPIEVERVIEGADGVAVETMNCKTEPVTRDFDCQEKGAFQEKAAGMIMEPVDSDVKLGTHKSDHEETSGTDDMAVDLGNSNTETDTQKSSREEPMISEGSTSEEEQPQSSQNPEISETPNKSSDATKPSDEEEDEEEEEPPPKKQKQLSLLSPITPATGQQAGPSLVGAISEPNLVNGNGSSTNGKKSSKKKSKNNNVWTKPTSRKGKKKSKNINSQSTPKATEDTVWITPVPRFLDKNDDSTDMKICLSKVYKAEKVELSDDRLTAGSCKGYRMVRATRGVTEGAWYFEIKVMSLGETGHTRLGWSTEKGDLQAPVGYDTNSFGYRDIDGSKVHKALREKYGEKGYKEGDVIGFYISLPEGNLYAPKPPRLVLYKGQRYVYAPDAKEEPPKVIPGSEISFFKNGVCQGVAFRDLYGGRYYPAASMYTLPNQPNCMVKFNFGPDFEHFPEDLGSRPAPAPMFEVPYHGFDHRVENGDSNEKNQ